jgi:hypothetical protein
MVFLFIMIVMVIDFASGIVISEFEMNPEGKDAGFEWVELYSEIEIELSEFTLKNNDGDEEDLAGNFVGYYVVEFDSQFLDNTDEKVILLEDDDEFYNTPTLDDTNNDERSWNLCDDEWVFIKSSKGEENDCPRKEGIVRENDDNREKIIVDVIEEVEKVEDVIDEVVEILGVNREIEVEKIVLNDPTAEELGVEGGFDSKDQKLKTWMLFAFLGFLLVLIALLALRRL